MQAAQIGLARTLRRTDCAHSSLASSRSEVAGQPALPQRLAGRVASPAASVASGAPKRGLVAVRADAVPSETPTAPVYSPPAPFYKVEAVLRPWRIKFVCKALLEQGIRGVTVSDARGFGSQGGSRERQAGSEFRDDNLVQKAKIEVVVVAAQVEDVIDTIIKEARTGEIGDGKIFVSPVAEVIRVRTGERGVEAERMAGGRQELLGEAHVYTSIDGGEML